MSKYLCNSIALILFAFNVIAQDKVIKADLNNDGVIDKAITTKDWGSSISTTSIQFIDGKSKRKYEFSGLYSTGSFFTIIYAPNVLNNSGRQQLGDTLFGRRDTVDASLKWLIDACSNTKKINDSQLIDFATNYTPVWISGEPRLPESYYSILKNSDFEKLLNVEGFAGHFKSDYFWIEYNVRGHKKEGVARLQGDGTLKTFKDTSDFNILKVDSVNWIYATSNGVVLKHVNEYSWVFINDDKLFEANEKLRWPSIIEVQKFNDLVLIRQSVRGSVKLFIVDPKSGIVVRLNNKAMQIDSVDEMRIDRLIQTLVVKDSDSNRTYVLTLTSLEEVLRCLGRDR